MAKQVLEIEIPTGKKAEWVDGFLKLVDSEQETTETKKDNRPITERVKTFEDACKELGEDHKLVQQFKAIKTAIAEDKEATAYFKLGIITAALNEGWKPDFTNDEEYRYYPWLCLWTNEELEQKTDAWKDERNLQLWVGGGDSNFGADVRSRCCELEQRLVGCVCVRLGSACTQDGGAGNLQRKAIHGTMG